MAHRGNYCRLEALRNNGGSVHSSPAALARDSCIFKKLTRYSGAKIEGIRCAQTHRSRLHVAAAFDDAQKERP